MGANHLRFAFDIVFWASAWYGKNSSEEAVDRSSTVRARSLARRNCTISHRWILISCCNKVHKTQIFKWPTLNKNQFGYFTCRCFEFLFRPHQHFHIFQPPTEWKVALSLKEDFDKVLHYSGSILLIPFLRLIKQCSGGLAFKIRASLSTTLVSAWVIKNVTGKTMNHVTKKLYGSGNCKISIMCQLFQNKLIVLFKKETTTTFAKFTRISPQSNYSDELESENLKEKTQTTICKTLSLLTWCTL